MSKFSYMLVMFIAFALTINAQNQFVGVKTCGMCHKKADQGEQLKIWEGSAHAKAFETLKSEKATKIAGGNAFENAECLACHTTGHGVDAALLGSKFNVEEGVQCEACHGAGSEYKSKKTMEDHAKSVAAGMTEYADEAAIEKHCRTCHNEKSPTHNENKFDFKKMWPKIAHPVPSKG